jgi:NADH dehydrogenase FAD-containing subunit
LGELAVTFERPLLAQLAQVARQQGIYLADVLNGKKNQNEEVFSFFNFG